MPLTNPVADAFGAITLGLVLLFALAGFCCLAYILYFRSQTRREDLHKFREFNSPWMIRTVLILFQILCVLGELSRIRLFRTHWFLHSLSLKWQETICRFHLMVFLGFTEPGFFLTLYFLVRRSLRHEANGRVFTFVLLMCLPTIIAQVCINVINPRIEIQKEGYGGKIPKYFTAAVFEEGNLAFCTYPLLSIIVHGVFVASFVSYFLYLGLKIISLAINKSLERRVWVMIFSVVVFLPLRILFLGFTVMSKPGELAFEALAFLGFLALLLSTSVSVVISVLRPIVDSLAVHWIFESREFTTQHQLNIIPMELNIIPMESFGKPLSSFLSDVDDDFSVGASQSHLATAV